MKHLALITAIAGLLGPLSGAAFAHGDEDHGTPKPAPKVDLGAATPLPWDVGGPYTLIDHTGAERSQIDPNGKFQLLFFGYANCPGICSAALPMMAAVANQLAAKDIPTTPVMITIDPTLDTVDTMAPALHKFSDQFVGLTGSTDALDQAYKGFNIQFEKIMDDPEYGPIYSHGSHIYLLDAQGKVLTLLPPVLSEPQVINIVAKYASEGAEHVN